MNSTTTCSYSNKVCGFGSCTLPTHTWHWGSSTCVTRETSSSSTPTYNAVIEVPANGTTTTNLEVISTVWLIFTLAIIIATAVAFITKKLT